jgi:uncharacterized membrane protein YcaP (DUF421 family)
MAFDPVNWRELFRVDIPLLEIFIRGTVMYLTVFAILRMTGRRLMGELAMVDFIFVLFLAIVADRAMMGNQHSIGSGIALLGTIVFWNYALNWLSYRIHRLERLVAAPPLLIIRDGRLLYRNMRQEFLTEDELRANLRGQGYDDVSTIERAFVEPDGRISVFPSNNGQSPQRSAATTPE